MKMRLLSEATFKFQQLKIWKCCFRARRPLNSKSWRCENKAFVWGFLQISNSKSWRCENEAFVRGGLQIPTSENANTCLQRSTSTGQSVSTHAKHNSTASSMKEKKKSPGTSWNHQFHCAHSAKQIRLQSGGARNRRASEPTFLLTGHSVYPKKDNVSDLQILTNKSHTKFDRTKLSREASFKCWREENKAFVWGFLQISNSKSWRCEHMSSTQQFQCTKCLNTCKTQ